MHHDVQTFRLGYGTWLWLASPPPGKALARGGALEALENPSKMGFPGHFGAPGASEALWGAGATGVRDLACPLAPRSLAPCPDPLAPYPDPLAPCPDPLAPCPDPLAPTGSKLTSNSVLHALVLVEPVSPWPVSPWSVSPWSVSPWPVSPWPVARGR
jgi:hypothetical protein